MNDIHNANNALLLYIDSLLFDIDAPQNECNERSIVRTRLESSTGNAEDVSGTASNSDFVRLMLFKVADIPLAISHASVDAVVDVGRTHLKRAMSKDGIVIRQWNYQGRDIHVIDTRDIVLPNGHPARHMNENEGNAHILILKGNAYGLLCDDVGASVDLEGRNVEWRLQRPTRRWLAGMVKGYNHALLDETEIIHFIEDLLSITH